MGQAIGRRIRKLSQVYREKGFKGALLFVLYRFRFWYSLMRIRQLNQSLGLTQSLFYQVQKARLRFTQSEQPYTLLSKFAQYPLKCRPNTTDILVFDQIFVQLEYRGLEKIRAASFIIDCGANVGYSSAYFLSHYPEAFLIAIEPDPGNFALLEDNLSPYGDRARAINSAIWSHPTGLVFSDLPFGDGREWATSMREQAEDEVPAMMAIDIGSLIHDSSFEKVSILKIDIEGAEEVVFSSNYQGWIKQVDNLVIEIHGENRRSILMKAIAGENFTVTENGELTICMRSPRELSQPGLVI